MMAWFVFAAAYNAALFVWHAVVNIPAALAGATSISPFALVAAAALSLAMVVLSVSEAVAITKARRLVFLRAAARRAWLVEWCFFEVLESRMLRGTSVYDAGDALLRVRLRAITAARDLARIEAAPPKP